MKHDKQPGRKVPSRNGGLKTVRCSCGWESHPGKVDHRNAEFDDHLAEQGEC